MSISWQYIPYKRSTNILSIKVAKYFQRILSDKKKTILDNLSTNMYFEANSMSNKLKLPSSRITPLVIYQTFQLQYCSVFNTKSYNIILNGNDI